MLCSKSIGKIALVAALVVGFVAQGESALSEYYELFEKYSTTRRQDLKSKLDNFKWPKDGTISVNDRTQIALKFYRLILEREKRALSNMTVGMAVDAVSKLLKSETLETGAMKKEDADFSRKIYSEVRARVVGELQNLSLNIPAGKDREKLKEVVDGSLAKMKIPPPKVKHPYEKAIEIAERLETLKRSAPEAAKLTEEMIAHLGETPDPRSSLSRGDRMSFARRLLSIWKDTKHLSTVEATSSLPGLLLDPKEIKNLGPGERPVRDGFVSYWKSNIENAKELAAPFRQKLVESATKELAVFGESVTPKAAPAPAAAPKVKHPYEKAIELAERIEGLKGTTSQTAKLTQEVRDLLAETPDPGATLLPIERINLAKRLLKIWRETGRLSLVESTSSLPRLLIGPEVIGDNAAASLPVRAGFVDYWKSNIEKANEIASNYRGKLVEAATNELKSFGETPPVTKVPPAPPRVKHPYEKAVETAEALKASSSSNMRADLSRRLAEELKETPAENASLTRAQRFELAKRLFAVWENSTDRPGIANATQSLPALLIGPDHIDKFVGEERAIRDGFFGYWKKILQNPDTIGPRFRQKFEVAATEQLGAFGEAIPQKDPSLLGGIAAKHPYEKAVELAERLNKLIGTSSQTAKLTQEIVDALAEDPGKIKLDRATRFKLAERLLNVWKNTGRSSLVLGTSSLPRLLIGPEHAKNFGVEEKPVRDGFLEYWKKTVRAPGELPGVYRAELLKAAKEQSGHFGQVLAEAPVAPLPAEKPKHAYEKAVEAAEAAFKTSSANTRAALSKEIAEVLQPTATGADGTQKEVSIPLTRAKRFELAKRLLALWNQTGKLPGTVLATQSLPALLIGPDHAKRLTDEESEIRDGFIKIWKQDWENPDKLAPSFKSKLTQAALEGLKAFDQEPTPKPQPGLELGRERPQHPYEKVVEEAERIAKLTHQSADAGKWAAQIEALLAEGQKSEVALNLAERTALAERLLASWKTTSTRMALSTSALPALLIGPQVVGEYKGKEKEVRDAYVAHWKGAFLKPQDLPSASRNILFDDALTRLEGFNASPPAIERYVQFLKIAAGLSSPMRPRWLERASSLSFPESEKVDEAERFKMADELEKAMSKGEMEQAIKGLAITAFEKLLDPTLSTPTSPEHLEIRDRVAKTLEKYSTEKGTGAAFKAAAAKARSHLLAANTPAEPTSTEPTPPKQIEGEVPGPKLHPYEEAIRLADRIVSQTVFHPDAAKWHERIEALLAADPKSYPSLPQAQRFQLAQHLLEVWKKAGPKLLQTTKNLPALLIKPDVAGKYGPGEEAIRDLYVDRWKSIYESPESVAPGYRTALFDDALKQLKSFGAAPSATEQSVKFLKMAAGVTPQSRIKWLERVRATQIPQSESLRESKRYEIAAELEAALRNAELDQGTKALAIPLFEKLLDPNLSTPTKSDRLAIRDNIARLLDRYATEKGTNEAFRSAAAEARKKVGGNTEIRLGNLFEYVKALREVAEHKAAPTHRIRLLEAAIEKFNPDTLNQNLASEKRTSAIADILPILSMSNSWAQKQCLKVVPALLGVGTVRGAVSSPVLEKIWEMTQQEEGPHQNYALREAAIAALKDLGERPVQNLSEWIATLEQIDRDTQSMQRIGSERARPLDLFNLPVETRTTDVTTRRDILNRLAAIIKNPTTLDGLRRRAINAFGDLAAIDARQGSGIPRDGYSELRRIAQLAEAPSYKTKKAVEDTLRRIGGSASLPSSTIFEMELYDRVQKKPLHEVVNKVMTGLDGEVFEAIRDLQAYTVDEVQKNITVLSMNQLATKLAELIEKPSDNRKAALTQVWRWSREVKPVPTWLSENQKLNEVLTHLVTTGDENLRAIAMDIVGNRFSHAANPKLIETLKRAIQSTSLSEEGRWLATTTLASQSTTASNEVAHREKQLALRIAFARAPENRKAAYAEILYKFKQTGAARPADPALLAADWVHAARTVDGDYDADILTKSIEQSLGSTESGQVERALGALLWLTAEPGGEIVQRAEGPRQKFTTPTWITDHPELIVKILNQLVHSDEKVRQAAAAFLSTREPWLAKSVDKTVALAAWEVIAKSEKYIDSSGIASRFIHPDHQENTSRKVTWTAEEASRALDAVTSISPQFHPAAARDWRDAFAAVERIKFLPGGITRAQLALKMAAIVEKVDKEVYKDSRPTVMSLAPLIWHGPEKSEISGDVTKQVVAAFRKFVSSESGNDPDLARYAAEALQAMGFKERLKERKPRIVHPPLSDVLGRLLSEYPDVQKQAVADLERMAKPRPGQISLRDQLRVWFEKSGPDFDGIVADVLRGHFPTTPTESIAKLDTRRELAKALVELVKQGRERQGFQPGLRPARQTNAVMAELLFSDDPELRSAAQSWARRIRTPDTGTLKSFTDRMLSEPDDSIQKAIAEGLRNPERSARSLEIVENMIDGKLDTFLVPRWLSGSRDIQIGIIDAIAHQPVPQKAKAGHLLLSKILKAPKEEGDVRKVVGHGEGAEVVLSQKQLELQSLVPKVIESLKRGDSYSKQAAMELLVSLQVPDARIPLAFLQLAEDAHQPKVMREQAAQMIALRDPAWDFGPRDVEGHMVVQWAWDRFLHEKDPALRREAARVLFSYTDYIHNMPGARNASFHGSEIPLGHKIRIGLLNIQANTTGNPLPADLAHFAERAYQEVIGQYNGKETSLRLIMKDKPESFTTPASNEGEPSRRDLVEFARHCIDLVH